MERWCISAELEKTGSFAVVTFTTEIFLFAIASPSIAQAAI